MARKTESTPELEKIDTRETDGSLCVQYIGERITTPDELLKLAGIDMAVWEIAELRINTWEVAGKANQGQTVEQLSRPKEDGSPRLIEELRWLPQKLWKTPLRQIAVKLRRKSNERLAIESLLEKLSELAPVVPKRPPAKLNKRGDRRCLEISIVDPHMGLQCFPPGSDQPWDLDRCEATCMWAVQSLLAQASVYEGIEEIVFPFGNDWMHCDGVFHTTTAGTPQPEAMSWHHVYERAEMLAIALIEELKKVAPVRVLEIPGNHDRQSAFTIGRVLRAYYRHDENVHVDASSSPYKFHRYGCNLIGYEHGHSISSIRLAALMANERPQDWAETAGGYREWHLGDQHRKGSSKPSAMEEQGVSVEYLPSLVAPNEWHRLKGFNFQKRGALGWVWDREAGPIARLQVNLNGYTGRPMKPEKGASRVV